MLTWQKKPLHFSIHLWVGLILLVLSLSITLATIFALKLLPSKLPLFYSLPWGEEQLVTHQQFLIIPACISAITVLNLAISWQLHQFQSFFKKILLLASIIAALILAVTFIKIIKLWI